MKKCRKVPKSATEQSRVPKNTVQYYIVQDSTIPYKRKRQYTGHYFRVWDSIIGYIREHYSIGENYGIQSTTKYRTVLKSTGEHYKIQENITDYRRITQST